MENEDKTSGLSQAIYARIIVPFTRELALRTAADPLISPALINPDGRDSQLEKIQLWAAKVNFAQPFPPRKELNPMALNLAYNLAALLKIIVEFDQELKPETHRLFIRLFTRKIRVMLYFLEEIAEIRWYLDFARKLLAIYEEFNSTDDTILKTRQQLIRGITRLYHEAFFEPDKSFFIKCTELALKNIELSVTAAPQDATAALNQYLQLGLDHLLFYYNLFNFNPDEIYINIEEFNKIRDLLKTKLTSFLREPAFYLNNPNLVYQAFTLFYRIRLANIQSGLLKQQGIEADCKKELVVLTTELIKMFYHDKVDFPLFFSNSRLQLNPEGKNNQQAFQKYLTPELYKNLSSQLSRLLNEKTKDVTGLLFLLSSFFGLFKEFFQVNVNNYKRILVLAAEFHNRKTNLITSMLYLKALYKVEIFEKNIRKLKADLEKKPVPSIIYYFNREIRQYADLPAPLKSELQIDTFITTIYLKEMDIKRYIQLVTDGLQEQGKLTQQNMNWLQLIKNELQNNFTLARNMDLIKDLGQLYCLFIDSYIKSERMEYREDFIQRATALKMQILDINPYHFLIALIYAKVGKLKLLQSSDTTLYYCMRKSRLTEVEKEKISSYIPHSLSYLPVHEEGIHWESVKEAISQIRKPAVSFGQVAPPGSRMLKALSAVINKITRQDISSDKLMASLYEEAYTPAQNEWALDPVILFYINKYVSKRGAIQYVSEIEGKKIEIQLSLYMNHQVKEKINLFMKNLIENTPATDMDVASQLEELSRLNEISLKDQSGELVRITINKIKEYIEEEKAVYLDSLYFEPKDIHYLTKILENYLTALSKQDFNLAFKFILNELIHNANNANLKKAHFLFYKLDMEQRYEQGMRNFADKRITQFSEYKRIINQEGYRVKVVFHVFKNSFIISVINNFKIHPREADIIHRSITESGGIRDIKQAFLKQTGLFEGADSSIVIMLLLLRKYGLYKEYFKVNIKENETIFRVTLPLSIVTEEQREVIAGELSREIDKLPMLQPYIQELRRVIHNPDSSLDQIEQVMRKNPLLVIDVLKMANSAFFSPGYAINSIKEAIKILGLKRLNNIIMVTNSFRLLKDKVSEKRLEGLIKHSELTAFYAREIIYRKKITQVDPDDVYLAALLHDIGIIIIEGLHPDVYMRIRNVLHNKQIPLAVLENLAGGINHALVGYKIAEKWKFSALLLEAIRYHHSPVDAVDHMNEVFIVYMANVFTYYNEGNFLYENIDPNVLVYFDLSSEEAVARLGSELKKSYVESISR